jgi:hypothetical protein
MIGRIFKSDMYLCMYIKKRKNVPVVGSFSFFLIFMEFDIFSRCVQVLVTIG